MKRRELPESIRELSAPLAVWDYVFALQECVADVELERAKRRQTCGHVSGGRDTRHPEDAVCHDGLECDPDCDACFFAGEASALRKQLRAYENQRRDSGANEPTDEEIYNGLGREGGIGYPLDDRPGSLGENDWRL